MHLSDRQQFVSQVTTVHIMMFVVVFVSFLKMNDFFFCLFGKLDAPCGSVCVRSIADTLQPSAETGPATFKSGHQLEHIR